MLAPPSSLSRVGRSDIVTGSVTGNVTGSDTGSVPGTAFGLAEGRASLVPIGLERHIVPFETLALRAAPQEDRFFNLTADRTDEKGKDLERTAVSQPRRLT
jgi:hypothetical protein